MKDRTEGAGLLEVTHTSYDIVLFDLYGCGRSDGEFSTFGLRESEDVVRVIRTLERFFEYSSWLLWGKEAGAVAAIRVCCSKKNAQLLKKIEGCVLDNPFSHIGSFVDYLRRSCQGLCTSTKATRASLSSG